jgi:hypothetical protein
MSPTPELLTMVATEVEGSSKPSQTLSETSTSWTYDRSVHVCALPDDVVAALQGLCDSPERHVALNSALRILDYRRSGFETSAMSMAYGEKLLSVKKIDIPVDGNTLVEHVIQATRNEIADLSQAGSLSDQVCAAVE